MASSVEVKIVERLLGYESSCRYKLAIDRELPWFDFVVYYSGSILRCRLFTTLSYTCINIESSLLSRSAGIGLYHAQCTTPTSLLTSFLCDIDHIMQKMRCDYCVYATL